MRLEVQDSIDRVSPAWDSLAPRGRIGLESAHLRAIERSGINRIEPFYLVAWEGPVPLGIAYCFVVEMDFGFLEKKLPAETLQTLRAWHPGFMKARMLECGFLTGLGQAIAAREGSLPEVCRAVAPELERIARDARADLVLVRDTPFAGRHDLDGFVERGFQPLLGFPVARMPLRWPSFEDYLQALKCTTRKRVRRALSRAGAQLETEVIPSFAPQAARLAQLWRQTHARAADYSHEELTEAYFSEIASQLPTRSHVMAVRYAGEIVAFSLCLLGDDEYFTAHAGFEYDVPSDDLHLQLSMAELRHALSCGKQTLNDGITTYDGKFKHGFEADPQVYFVKHVKDARLTTTVARRLQEAMPQPENVHRPFHDQDVSGRPRPAELAAQLATPARGPDIFGKTEELQLYRRANDARVAGLYGFFPPFESAQGPLTRLDGRSVVMLGSNAYLGLGSHPELVAAAKTATEKYGTGCSGSPFLNGTLDIHVDLARALAEFMQKEDALLCSTGYQTNLGVVAALAGENDVLIMDRLDHASLVDGARLSHAQVARFRHNDLASLEQALVENEGKPKLVVVDSVFSMEGTIADLPAIVALARRHGARVMVDEAHAIGVLGPGGRGASELHRVLADVDIVMGTFSKSFASVGGFVAGDARVIDYLRHATRSHMFSASLPPAAVAAARTALEIIKREPERRARVLANAEYMSHRLQELGYDAPFRGTAIVPVHCGQELLAFGCYRKLLDQGVFVNPVASPAVAHGRELLRTSYMATHDQEMLDHAAGVFASLRTESFPTKSRAAVAKRATRLRVRPLVFLPVADRRSFPRYYVSSLEHGILRVPGHTQLGLGQPVDCGISFGREGVILQAPGRVVSKCLVPAPGRSLGVDVELLATEPRARSLIESFVAAGSLPQGARHSWRYHADIDVEYPADGIAQLDTLEDISIEGAAIRGPHPPGLGAHVPLRLLAPDGPPIELVGEVRWRRPGDEPLFGVHFEFPNPGERSRVLGLIRSLRAAISDPATSATVH